MTYDTSENQVNQVNWEKNKLWADNQTEQTLDLLLTFSKVRTREDGTHIKMKEVHNLIRHQTTLEVPFQSPGENFTCEYSWANCPKCNEARWKKLVMRDDNQGLWYEKKLI